MHNVEFGKKVDFLTYMFVFYSKKCYNLGNQETKTSFLVSTIQTDKSNPNNMKDRNEG